MAWQTFTMLQHPRQSMSYEILIRGFHNGKAWPCTSRGIRVMRCQSWKLPKTQFLCSKWNPSNFDRLHLWCPLRYKVLLIMNLSRPINVLPGTRPPSVLNLTQESTTSEKQKTLTSFYLPHETEKTLCINSATTTRDVIRSLLSKFRIVDNPHKYVLYEKKPFSNGRRRSSETSTVTISGKFYTSLPLKPLTKFYRNKDIF